MATLRVTVRVEFFGHGVAILLLDDEVVAVVENDSSNSGIWCLRATMNRVGVSRTDSYVSRRRSMT